MCAVWGERGHGGGLTAGVAALPPRDLEEHESGRRPLHRLLRLCLRRLSGGHAGTPSTQLAAYLPLDGCADTLCSPRVAAPTRPALAGARVGQRPRWTSQEVGATQRGHLEQRPRVCARAHTHAPCGRACSRTLLDDRNGPLWHRPPPLHTPHGKGGWGWRSLSFDLIP